MAKKEAWQKMMLSNYPNFDFPMFLNNNGLSYKNYEKEISINCPFCSVYGKTPDTEKKLWINSEKSLFLCYRCDAKGPVQRLISAIKRIPQDEALKILQGDETRSWNFLRSNLIIPRYAPDLEELNLKEIDLPYDYVPFKQGDQSDYLSSRNIPMDYAVANSWGYSETGYTKGRLIVPFFDDEGKICFYQCRKMGELAEGEKKTLNPKGVSSKKIFYNLNKIEDNKIVYLVEGFVDAAKVESLGLCALATNGKTIGVEQIRLLKRTKVEKIVVAFDLDAYENSVKVGRDLESFDYEVRVVQMPDSRDAGDYPWESEELRNLLCGS